MVLYNVGENIKVRNMCGRFALVTPVAELKKRFNVKLSSGEINPRYNVAPGQMMPVVDMADSGHIIFAKWGLVPHWAKDPKIGYKMINVRAETILEKPSFRDVVRTHRCLVLADGFYEWDKKGDKKIPYYISLKNKEPFAFAGICAQWHSDQEMIQSFSIITTDANDLVGKIHDRMPVMLKMEDEKQWLDASIKDDEIAGFLHKYPDDKMSMYSVSALVNNPRNDISDIMIPV